MIRNRCAIYTRKSTEEGLEQEFNSLDAQSESCAAYILSQAGEGWEDARRIYSDGGILGGHMERLGLKDMLSDIEAGHIDVIVVYKVDRLTRSLADFAKLVEIFDAHDVSFVSVTQAFNTTNSMGRLTLNVLLSFAQFEREVTAERIRDKIAASKKKGKWMGGLVPLGYDVIDKKLIVNDREAKVIRLIFETFQTLGSVSKVKQELDQQGITTKVRYRKNRGLISSDKDSQKLIKTGGLPFHRGHLYQILSNPLYIGKVRHKDKVYEGKHEALIPQELWDTVQTKLKSNSPKRTRPTNTKTISLLKGILFDQTGDRLGPSHLKKSGRNYSYYISRRLIKGEIDDGTGWRLPAKEIETHVVKLLTALLNDQARILNLVEKGRANGGSITSKEVQGISQKAEDLTKQLSDKRPSRQRGVILELVERTELHPETIILSIKTDAFDEMSKGVTTSLEYPLRLKRRGIETRLIIGGKARNEPDPKILKAIAKSRHWYAQLKTGEVKSVNALASRENVHRADVGKLLLLAFLSPKVIRRFLNGGHPADLTLDALKRKLPKLPSDWNEQAYYLGMPN